MAPKKRSRAIETEADAPLQRQMSKKGRVAEQPPESPGAKRASGQTAVASHDVVVALASALGKSVAGMPPVRKTIHAGEQVASVYDAIAVFKGCSANAARKEFTRLAECHPEVAAGCRYFKFAGRRQRETPVADAKTLVQIILLLPGEQAAKVRTEASRVFVDFWGGNVVLVVCREVVCSVFVRMLVHPVAVVR